MRCLSAFCVMLALMFSVSSCSSGQLGGHKDPVDYVDPYVGNISHLLVPTFPTVHLPNSMLRVYPERGDFTTDFVNGLPIIVTSHRGSSAFNLSPITNLSSSPSPVIRYSYDLEKIKPYRYSVYLDDEQIEVDYAPSHQSAVYELKFNKDGANSLIINTRNGELFVGDDNSIEGYQIIDRGPTKIYLYLETEQTPIKTARVQDASVDSGKKSVQGRDAAIALTFAEDVLNVRYGVSFISSEQAKKNLEREINTYSVDQVAKVGRDKWNEVLGKIKVSGSDESLKTVFYTSLYRTYERMINLSEDGRYYSASDQTVHDDHGIPFYTDDWIWDTYRATHPLRVLIEADMEEHMITSYIRMAEQTKEGWMPTFPEVTGDSHRMNGNHAVAVVWDAYCKGLTDFDLEGAYNACKGAITEKSLLPWIRETNNELDEQYLKEGFYPALKPGEKEYCSAVHPFEKRQAISVILGNSYDYWCLAMIARHLEKMDDYKLFLERSYNYRNVFNSKTMFFHPKDRNGDFIEPFDYRYAGGQGARDYYGENNGWIYRWDVQHNVADLVELMGGAKNFVNNLNRTFREPLGKSKFEFYDQLPDHTGNVGQFSMANEPCLHIPYLYNYAGEPWKTQKRIRTLLHQWFRNDLMGVPGDEDGGGMTAFVVFSTLGFYPVTPGSDTYNIGSPSFEKATIKLSNGNEVEIVADNYSPNNKYIQSATINGKTWDKPWFSHSDIVDGATIKFVMGDKPNYSWGADLDNVPPSSGYYERQTN